MIWCNLGVFSFQSQVGHMMDLRRAESQAAGGSDMLEHTYSVLQNMTSEHYPQTVAQTITGQQQQQMSHLQTSSSLSGGQQTLHHVNNGSPVEMQDATMSVRPQPISVVVQSPPSLLDQGPRSQYQGLQHCRQPAVVVQVIGGNSTEGVEFQHIPESESISRSISPITAALHTDQDVAYSNQNLLAHGSNTLLQNVPRTP